VRAFNKAVEPDAKAILQNSLRAAYPFDRALGRIIQQTLCRRQKKQL
jgi:hypothetical protein